MRLHSRVASDRFPNDAARVRCRKQPFPQVCADAASQESNQIHVYADVGSSVPVPTSQLRTVATKRALRAGSHGTGHMEQPRTRFFEYWGQPRLPSTLQLECCPEL